MARQLKDKMKMPEKRRDEAELDEELDLDLAEEEFPMDDEMPEEEISEEGAEEEGELEVYSDDEILEEARKRGLMPEEEEEISEEEEELSEEDEEMEL